jgi:hypothetical protein
MLLFSLGLLIACLGLAYLMGMPYARIMVTLGIGQLGLVAWMTQEKKK